jgi:hypothetical protein
MDVRHSLEIRGPPQQCEEYWEGEGGASGEHSWLEGRVSAYPQRKHPNVVLPVKVHWGVRQEDHSEVLWAGR